MDGLTWNNTSTCTESWFTGNEKTLNQHPRNHHFLTALMQDLEEASTALKGHRETLENATSEEEAQHHYHNDSRCLICFFDKHLTPFRMVAPSNAPSPDLRGLTQPQKNIRITNHQQNWNCDFGLECCFKSQHFRTGATNNC